MQDHVIEQIKWFHFFKNSRIRDTVEAEIDDIAQVFTSARIVTLRTSHSVL